MLVNVDVGSLLVFSQVKAFLPELARANTELDAKVQKEGREEVLVEREEEVEGEHIEMVVGSHCELCEGMLH